MAIFGDVAVFFGLKAVPNTNISDAVSKRTATVKLGRDHPMACFIDITNAIVEHRYANPSEKSRISPKRREMTIFPLLSITPHRL